MNIPTETEIRDMLCHTWKYESFQSGPQKLPLPGILPASIRFIPDGTLIEVDRYGDTTTGTWSFKYKTLAFNFVDKKGEEKNKLIHIDQTTMMFRNKYAGVYSEYTLRRID
jgi:hypothetical protein